MRICLVAAFPPSRRQLNEYSFHIAREIQRHAGVELIILADELSDYNFATDSQGEQIRSEQPRASGVQRGPLLEIRRPGDSGATAEYHPAPETRCRVVQSGLLQLWYAGNAIRCLRRLICPGAHACGWLLH